MQQTILEASRIREPILKKIDDNFAKLKMNPKDSAVKRELKQNILKFTGVKTVLISFKTDYFNASVFPIYNNDIIKDFKFKKTMAKEDVSNNKYIKKIYITFGIDLLNKLSSKELTAILLHELGHVYNHTTHIWNILSKIAPTLAFVLFLPSALPALIPYFIVSRTLNFFDHKEEYNADHYAIKYGYGDEMIKVFKKFNHIETAKKSKIKILLTKMYNIIVGTTHPDSKKRACKTAQEMYKDYKKLYPKQTKELTLILNDLNCKI